jgi:hypothetical protein
MGIPVSGYSNAASLLLYNHVMVCTEPALLSS